MSKKTWRVEDATEDTISAFDTVSEITPAKTYAHVAPEVITGVVLTRCKVISYNPYSNIIVYERDGQQYQTNAITDYHGEGYIEIE